MTDNTQQSGISRRTVTKAMAWAVPTVAVAATIPMAAASISIIDISGAGCKLPGASNDIYKGYAFRMTATNTDDQPITIDITNVVLNGTNLGDVTVVNLANCTVLGDPFQVPANTTLSNLVLITENAANSANGQLVVNFTVNGDNVEAPETASVSGLNPINGASCSTFSKAEKDCLAAAAFQM